MVAASPPAAQPTSASRGSVGSLERAHRREHDGTHQRGRPGVERRKRPIREDRRREAPERLRDQSHARPEARTRTPEEQPGQHDDRDRRGARGEEGLAQDLGRLAADEMGHRVLPRRTGGRERRTRRGERDREAPLRQDGSLAEVAKGPRRPERRRRADVASLVRGIGLVPRRPREEHRLKERQGDRDRNAREPSAAPRRRCRHLLRRSVNRAAARHPLAARPVLPHVRPALLALTCPRRGRRGCPSEVHVASGEPGLERPLY